MCGTRVMIAAIRALPDEGKGILCMVTTIFFFSMMDAVGKGLTERYDPVQVVWARYAGQTFWVFLALAPSVPSLMRTRFLGMQALRSAALFCATLFFFSGFAVLPLATNAAIFQVGPLFVTALAFVLLREKVGPRRWFAVIAGLVGALIIIRPGSGIFSLYALLPLAAALGYAAYMVSTRFLGGEESPWTSFLYTALFGTVAASLVVPFFWTTPTWADAAILGTFGIFGAIGHFTLILGLRFATASMLAPFAYVSLVFSTVWGYLFFTEFPDGWTFAGAFVIVGAGLYVWHRERRVRRRPV